MDIKDFIKKNCLTKTGKLNNHVNLQQWWDHRGFHKECQHIKNAFGQTFTQKIFNILNDIDSDPICVTCNVKPTKFINFTDGYREYCSVVCSGQGQDRNQKISLKLKANTERFEKIRQTNIQKYGVASLLNNSDFQHHMVDRKIEKYGSLELARNESKRKQTLLERYGTDNCNEIVGRKQTMHLKKIQLNPNYAVYSSEALLELYEYYKSSYIIAEILKVTPKTISDWIKKHGGSCDYKSKITLPHFMLLEFLDKHKIDYVVNHSSLISPKEIDIFIPSFNLAIEVNGIYWHSYQMNNDRNRHFNKRKLLADKEIKLLQFWDNDIVNKFEKVCSIIANNLNLNQIIYARNTTVQIISKQQYIDFMNNNHLNGCRPASLRLGLFYKGELIQAIGLGNSRYDKTFDYELIRAATKNGWRVIGGLSKLLSRVEGNSIISYCDMMQYDGKGYKACGFELSHLTKPNYHYYKNSKIFSRQAFQKHKLCNKLESFDPNKTEQQNMLDNGYMWFYDCGHMVWIKQ